MAVRSLINIINHQAFSESIYITSLIVGSVSIGRQWTINYLFWTSRETLESKPLLYFNTETCTSIRPIPLSLLFLSLLSYHNIYGFFLSIMDECIKNHMTFTIRKPTYASDNTFISFYHITHESYLSFFSNPISLDVN